MKPVPVTYQQRQSSVFSMILSEFGERNQFDSALTLHHEGAAEARDAEKRSRLGSEAADSGDDPICRANYKLGRCSRRGPAENNDL